MIYFASMFWKITHACTWMSCTHSLTQHPPPIYVSCYLDLKGFLAQPLLTVLLFTNPPPTSSGSSPRCFGCWHDWQMVCRACWCPPSPHPAVGGQGEPHRDHPPTLSDTYLGCQTEVPQGHNCTLGYSLWFIGTWAGSSPFCVPFWKIVFSDSVVHCWDHAQPAGITDTTRLTSFSKIPSENYLLITSPSCVRLSLWEMGRI